MKYADEYKHNEPNLIRLAKKITGRRYYFNDVTWEPVFEQYFKNADQWFYFDPDKYYESHQKPSSADHEWYILHCMETFGTDYCPNILQQLKYKDDWYKSPNSDLQKATRMKYVQFSCFAFIGVK